MIAELGIVTTGLAFCAAVYALVAALLGTSLRRDSLVVSGRNAALMTFPADGLQFASIFAMLNHKFSIAYVAGVQPRHARIYLITGLWAARRGRCCSGRG
jgi:cytochrome c biogenesis factor